MGESNSKWYYKGGVGQNYQMMVAKTASIQVLKMRRKLQIGSTICSVVLMLALVGCSFYKMAPKGNNMSYLDPGYFKNAKELKFLVSGKKITDRKNIADVLRHLDLSSRRRIPCKCDGLSSVVTLNNGKKVFLELCPHGWGFKEDRGNIRYIKNPSSFEKLYNNLWDKYGPESGMNMGTEKNGDNKEGA